MIQFRTFELTTLIDVLADFRCYYDQMKTAGSSTEEVKTCKETIQSIQREINFRNNLQLTVNKN
jgi:hypothetical protein